MDGGAEGDLRPADSSDRGRCPDGAEAERWQFWIDVGGTFTDCLGRSPRGKFLRQKLLSSGVIKGRARFGVNRRQIIDPSRCSDPNAFWSGYALRLVSPNGKPIAHAEVEHFDATTGTLDLDRDLPECDEATVHYELNSDEESPRVAIRYLLACRRADPLPPMSVRLGTTLGTNALITRRGAATALVTTRGFGDILEIGYQNRPRLFELAIAKRKPLYQTVVEIDERIGSDGSVLKPANRDQIARSLASLPSLGIRSLAVCLLNAYANPVHTHMTNTRLTDPEVMEQRFPVRLLEFSTRRESGGRGLHRGGDGTVRRIEFLKPLDLSILSQRRGAYLPFGLAGGKPGQAGRQILVHSESGKQEVLPASAHVSVRPGDILLLETPGGGGFGTTRSKRSRVAPMIFRSGRSIC